MKTIQKMKIITMFQVISMSLNNGDIFCKIMPSFYVCNH